MQLLVLMPPLVFLSDRGSQEGGRASDAPIRVVRVGKCERVKFFIHDALAVACAGSDRLVEGLATHAAFPYLVFLAGRDMKVGSWGALCLHGRHCLRLGVHWDPPVLVASSHNGGSSFAL